MPGPPRVSSPRYGSCLRSLQRSRSSAAYRTIRTANLVDAPMVAPESGDNSTPSTMRANAEAARRDRRRLSSPQARTIGRSLCGTPPRAIAATGITRVDREDSIVAPVGRRRWASGGARAQSFLPCPLRDLTPAPPPFSSMNSAPADSIAFRRAARVEPCAASMPGLDSRRLMVGRTPKTRFLKSPLLPSQQGSGAFSQNNPTHNTPFARCLSTISARVVPAPSSRIAVTSANARR